MNHHLSFEGFIRQPASDRLRLPDAEMNLLVAYLPIFNISLYRACFLYVLNKYYSFFTFSI